MEKLVIDRPVIVEGKYDKITLDSVLDATIIPTDGFSIFNRREKMALIRRLGEKNGVIVLTDSDGAGKLIRAHLSSALPKEKILHLYTPALPGKERRKKTASRAGLLGVEGMDAALLRELFAPYATNGCVEKRKKGPPIEKRDFYADGLSGGSAAAQRRAALSALLGLPTDITANALLAAVNLLMSYEDYKQAVQQLDADRPQPVQRADAKEDRKYTD